MGKIKKFFKKKFEKEHVGAQQHPDFTLRLIRNL